MVDGFYKQVTTLLRLHGFEFWKAGKGSHEKWRNSDTGRIVIVPQSTRSRHTANEILKQAKIDEKL